VAESKIPISRDAPEPSPVMQQMQLLNFRIVDMITQLNTVIKTMTDENLTLKKENADLKAKLQTN
jgi:regulator of replication initiation timing